MPPGAAGSTLGSMRAPRRTATHPRRVGTPGRAARRAVTAARLVLATAALGVAAPATASADSFVFRDGRDVRTINAADDREGLRITGDATHYATLPTMDDAGNLSVIVRENGTFTPELAWFGIDGRVVRNVLPEEGNVGLNTGPLSVRVDPGGTLYAYTYLRWEGIDRSPTPWLAIVDPSAALPPKPAISRQGFSHASWFDGRLVVSDGDDLLAETSATNRLDLAAWPAGSGLTTADVSRDGRRAVVSAGSRRQLLADLTPGGPPTAQVTASCLLPDDGSDLYRGGASSAALSPDGRHVAYAGQGGLRIATIGAITGTDGPCPLGDVRLVSEQGGLPSASGYTVPAPVVVADPPPRGGTTTTTTTTVPDPPKPKPKPTSKRLTVKAATRKGTKVTVSFVCPGRCSYDARLLKGRKTLKRRKGTAKAGRTTRIVLSGARGKGLKVRLKAGGATVTRSVR